MSGTFKDSEKKPRPPKDPKPEGRGGQRNLVREALEELSVEELVDYNHSVGDENEQ